MVVAARSLYSAALFFYKVIILPSSSEKHFCYRKQQGYKGLYKVMRIPLLHNPFITFITLAQAMVRYVSQKRLAE